MKQVKNKTVCGNTFCLSRGSFPVLFIFLVLFFWLPIGAQQPTNGKKTEDSKSVPEQEEVNVLNGKQKKQYVTGAASQLPGKVIVNNPIINNSLKLTGQLPGLTIFQSDGEPGVETARTLLRGKRSLGTNTPVVMVDGYERDFSLLDPNEIESVTLLKDAAATAQYGLRGGNGIIAITTRRGTVGKIRISLNASAGIKEATTRPCFLNAYNYGLLFNEAKTNDIEAGIDKSRDYYSEAVLSKYKLAATGVYENEMDRYLYPDINWYEQYVKKSTWQQHYNVNVNGGNQFATYFVSVGYTNNSGLFNVDKSRNTYNTNADMKMFTLRSNVDIQATDKLKIALGLSGRQEERTNPGDIGNYSSRIFGAMYQTPPNATPVFVPDGYPGGTKDYTNNPYGLLNMQGYSLYFIRNMFADAKAVYDLDFITKGLKVEGSVAFDSWYDQQTTRNKTFKVYNINTTTQADGTLQPVYDSKNRLVYTETGTDGQMGVGGSYPQTLRVFAMKFNLNYEKHFGKNYLYTMLGYSQRTLEQETNTNLPRQYRGLFSRISYAYNNRYLGEVNMGYEGSEQMPGGHKYGLFPAFSAGWVLSEENFLQGNNLINFLKMRASYGISGNDNHGGYFAYMHYYKKGTGNTFGTSFTGQDGWEESAIPQKNITWEKVKKANVGIDAMFFKNRLSIQADAFQERNSDIMVDAPFSLVLGTKTREPLGKVENKGFEFLASWNDRIGKLEYSLTGVYSTSKNKIIEMGEITPIYDYQKQTGLSLNPAFGFEALRYFTAADMSNPDIPSQSEYGTMLPGDIMYKDQNTDGVINEYDKVYLGPKDTNNQASLGLGLKYKGFDLNVQFLGQWGGSMSLNNESAYEFYKNGGVSEHHLNRYNPRDPGSYEDHGMKFYKGDYPRLTMANVNNRQESSFWRVPTDMLRLKTVELGYSFKKEWIQKIRLQTARMYVNGFNLYTWSHSGLVDIESGSGSGMVYPIQKIWNFGINLSF